MRKLYKYICQSCNKKRYSIFKNRSFCKKCFKEYKASKSAIIFVIFFLLLPTITHAGMFECDFSVPVNLGNVLAPDYEYQHMSCATTTLPVRIEEINEDSTLITVYATSSLPVALIELATSSPQLLTSNNMENITYVATTTYLGGGTSIVQASYTLPYLLFKFILALMTIALLITGLFYFIKKRKNNL